jgi:hypothetical protein
MTAWPCYFYFNKWKCHWSLEGPWKRFCSFSFLIKTHKNFKLVGHFSKKKFWFYFYFFFLFEYLFNPFLNLFLSKVIAASWRYSRKNREILSDGHGHHIFIFFFVYRWSQRPFDPSLLLGLRRFSRHLTICVNPISFEYSKMNLNATIILRIANISLIVLPCRCRGAFLVARYLVCIVQCSSPFP